MSNPEQTKNAERQARKGNGQAQAETPEVSTADLIRQAQEAADAQRKAMEEELARLKAENEVLKTSAKAKGTKSIKVSEKGAVSVYGLGRFPVTLYQEQWADLLAMAPDIQAFILANKARLATRESKAQRQAQG